MDRETINELVDEEELIDDTAHTAALPSSAQMIFLGLVLGFVKVMFLGGLSENLGTVVDLAIVLFLFVGIVGIFRDQM